MAGQVNGFDNVDKESSKASAWSTKKDEHSSEQTSVENSKEDRASAAPELSNDESLSQYNGKASAEANTEKAQVAYAAHDGCKPSADKEKCSSEHQSADSECLDLHDFQKHQSKPVTMCPHKDRKHYAKGMCSSCYRRFGRQQNATKCGHSDRLLYSMGMCQTCYMADYHQRRTKPMKKLIQKQLMKQGVLKEKMSSKTSIPQENQDGPSVDDDRN